MRQGRSRCLILLKIARSRIAFAICLITWCVCVCMLVKTMSLESWLFCNYDGIMCCLSLWVLSLSCHNPPINTGGNCDVVLFCLCHSSLDNMVISSKAPQGDCYYSDRGTPKISFNFWAWKAQLTLPMNFDPWFVEQLRYHLWILLLRFPPLLTRMLHPYIHDATSPITWKRLVRGNPEELPSNQGSMYTTLVHLLQQSQPSSQQPPSITHEKTIETTSRMRPNEGWYFRCRSYDGISDTIFTLHLTATAMHQSLRGRRVG